MPLALSSNPLARHYDFTPWEPSFHEPQPQPAWTPRLCVGAHMNIYAAPTTRTTFLGVAAVLAIGETKEELTYFLTECSVRFLGTGEKAVHWIRTDKSAAAAGSQETTQETRRLA